MSRVLTAGLLGGVAIYIWGAVSWMALPWHNMAMHSLPSGSAVVQALQGQQLEHGVYMYPGMAPDESAGAPTQATEESIAAAWRSGPLIPFMVYKPTGTDPMEATNFLRGLILALAAGVLLAWLLSLALPSLPGFGRRVVFVAAIGIFSAVVGPLNMWNWMLFPLDYTAMGVADLVITSALAGAVIAWRLRSPRPGTGTRGIAMPSEGAYQPPVERSPR